MSRKTFTISIFLIFIFSFSFEIPIGVIANNNLSLSNGEDSYDAITFSTNIETGLDELSTLDLPKTEKNRINSSLMWHYEDRGLKQPIISYDVDIPLLNKQETFDVSFGACEGMRIIVSLSVTKYKNGTTIPIESQGDLDLFLFREGSSNVLQSSTNDEGSDESIDYNVGENYDNYTLRVLHDEKDSTKDNATAYLIIQTRFYSHVSQFQYFEGRDLSNQPTKYSSWAFFSSSVLSRIAVIPFPNTSDAIDLYQVRQYIENETQDLELINWDDAQTNGVPIYLDYDDDRIKYLEVEAEWSVGYVYLCSDTSYFTTRLLTNQRRFPYPYDMNSYEAEENNFTKIVIFDPSQKKIIDIPIFQEYHYYGNHIYELSYRLEDFSNTFSFYEYDNSSDIDPIIDNTGFRGPSELGNYQIYTRIRNLSGYLPELNLYISFNDGTSYTNKSLYWISEDYYGCCIKGEEIIGSIEDMKWYIETTQYYPDIEYYDDEGGDSDLPIGGISGYNPIFLLGVSIISLIGLLYVKKIKNLK